MLDSFFSHFTRYKLKRLYLCGRFSSFLVQIKPSDVWLAEKSDKIRMFSAVYRLVTQFVALSNTYVLTNDTSTAGTKSFPDIKIDNKKKFTP